MKVVQTLSLIVALGCSHAGAAQDVSNTSDVQAERSAGVGSPVIVPFSVPKSQPERSVSWPRLVPNLVHDQKQIALFPRSLARGNHLRPTIAFAGVTAALVAGADVPVAEHFRRTTSFAGFNRALSSTNTSAALFAIPSAFYAVGLARRDAYAQHTFLLAGEAVLDSEILTSVMKDIDRRLYPGDVPPNGDFAGTWFKKTTGGYVGGMGSFPSGHGIAAFSLATVFADRYRNHAWVRWTSYGLAGVVSFSRLSLQAHFLSDSVAGGVIGYVVAHNVVLHN